MVLTLIMKASEPKGDSSLGRRLATNKADVQILLPCVEWTTTWNFKLDRRITFDNPQADIVNCQSSPGEE